MFRRLAPFAADLWQHRELLWKFTQLNVELRHKGSHLGLAWSFISPLLMLGMYVLVFGHIFGGRFGINPNETPVEYALGIFIGLTLLHFVTEVFANAPGIILSNANLVKKVVFPLTVLPAATVGAAFIHLLISLTLTLSVIVIGGVPLTLSALWLPALLLPLVLLALGLGWFFAAIGVFFRDIGQITQFLSMTLLWGSGVFFTAEKHPEAWRYLRYNPLLLAIEFARDALLWQRPVNLYHLLYVYVFGIVVCFGGYAVFEKARSEFSDSL